MLLDLLWICGQCHYDFQVARHVLFTQLHYVRVQHVLCI